MFARHSKNVSGLIALESVQIQPANGIPRKCVHYVNDGHVAFLSEGGEVASCRKIRGFGYNARVKFGHYRALVGIR